MYVGLELVAAVWVDSLSLISDGFHNLSDVFSIYIAYYSAKLSKRSFSVDDTMSYGWARSEVLGGLTNGCFLFALCVYIVLETIPRLISPTDVDDPDVLIWTAAIGVIINTIGSIAFAVTGISHGHSHSHTHSHGEEEDHGHHHNHNHHNHYNHHNHHDHHEHHDHERNGHKKQHKHGHSHHHHYYETSIQEQEYDEVQIPKSPILESDSDSDTEDNGNERERNEHNHSHQHKERNQSNEYDLQKDILHSRTDRNSLSSEETGSLISGERMVSHQKEREKKTKQKKSFFSNWKLDLNIGAVFLHYVGDMFSSALVLVSGLLIKHFDGEWTQYVDPVTSLLIVVLIFWSTYPLVQRACMILMQSTPTDFPLKLIRRRIKSVPHVLNIHDFHVWRLVDDLMICSMHISVESSVRSFDEVVETIKNILHEYGIHSSAIQPEFTQLPNVEESKCKSNCIQECDADWCCKSVSETESETESN